MSARPTERRVSPPDDVISSRCAARSTAGGASAPSVPLAEGEQSAIGQHFIWNLTFEKPRVMARDYEDYGIP
jgi:hypothetical protein